MFAFNREKLSITFYYNRLLINCLQSSNCKLQLAEANEHLPVQMFVNAFWIGEIKENELLMNSNHKNHTDQKIKIKKPNNLVAFIFWHI